MRKERDRFLMCPPDYFDVKYVINPWMDGNVGKAARPAAQEQWSTFYSLLKEVADVELIPAQPGLPDMVFTANAGVVLGNKVALTQFMHRERQGEEPLFEQWFKQYGFDVLNLNRVEADIDPRNDSSAKSLLRLGFSKEGDLRERWIVDGEVSDTALFGLLQREWMARS